MKLNLPERIYDIEILGIYDRPLTAKEVKEHFEFWQKQMEVQEAMSIGKEENLGAD
jgi:hypothetical protein